MKTWAIIAVTIMNTSRAVVKTVLQIGIRRAITDTKSESYYREEENNDYGNTTVKTKKYRLRTKAGNHDQKHPLEKILFLARRGRALKSPSRQPQHPPPQIQLYTKGKDGRVYELKDTWKTKIHLLIRSKIRSPIFKKRKPVQNLTKAVTHKKQNQPPQPKSNCCLSQNVTPRYCRERFVLAQLVLALGTNQGT